MYKTPQDPRNPQRFISQGVAFYYMDSHRPELTLSVTPINAEEHALYNTLQQIYLNVGFPNFIQPSLISHVPLFLLFAVVLVLNELSLNHM